MHLVTKLHFSGTVDNLTALETLPFYTLHARVYIAYLIMCQILFTLALVDELDFKLHSLYNRK